LEKGHFNFTFDTDKITEEDLGCYFYENNTAKEIDN